MVYPHKPARPVSSLVLRGWASYLMDYGIRVRRYSPLGLSNLLGLHLNDARTTLGSKKDKRKYQAYTSETDSNCVWAAEVRVSYRMAEIRGGMTNTATETTAN